MRPHSSRREERAARARDTASHAVPSVLRTSPRARHGIHRAELIVDPPAEPTAKHGYDTQCQTGVKIRVQCTDTLSAAMRMSAKACGQRATSPSGKTQAHLSNVTILNMASQTRPGGGFLEGGNSQEEFLCARTTLFPSLWDHFYRLPDVGGVFSPDVMVFRDHLPEANELAKRDRFFVNVISAGMFRFADAQAEECSCGVSYCDRHRSLVSRKMKAVLRTAQAKGVKRLVLGAWGCGAYGNPVTEIARLWRKVIAGSLRQRRPNAETWEGIEEIVFAIPDWTVAQEFELAFEDVLTAGNLSPKMSPTQSRKEADVHGANVSDLMDKIVAMETQMEQTKNPRTRARLRETLASYNRELARGLTVQDSNEDLTLDSRQGAEADDEDDDEDSANSLYDNSLYNFDEDDVASDSSDCCASEIYDFHGHAPRPRHRPETKTSQHRFAFRDGHGPKSHSPRLDPETGWFNGSMDELHALMKVRTHAASYRKNSMSHGSPVSHVDSTGLLLDEARLHDYLRRFGGSDIEDY